MEESWGNHGGIVGDHGGIMEELWGNHGGIVGESWRNHGGIMVESWGNHGGIMEESWRNHARRDPCEFTRPGQVHFNSSNTLNHKASR